FYRDLAPRAPAPHCYWCDFDPGTGAFGILLPDLAHMASEDQLVGTSLSRLGTAIAGLADMHAHWWTSPNLDAYRWLCRPLDMYSGVVELYRGWWPVFYERFGPILPRGAGRFGDAAADAMHAVLEGQEGRPETLVHGDFKVDNLFFGGVPERMVAVDWALAARGPGAMDVALFLTQSSSVEVRRARQWDVLRSWHDRICQQGATTYSYEDAVDDYRRSALLYLVHPVAGGAHFEPGHERTDRLLATLSQRAFSAAVDLGLDELLP
ncbi:MAG TPA: phosphotransferase, partial [Acidimicrobiales bacterium]|nr:phosphotransferase [Acidimicrobiales bacterium]